MGETMKTFTIRGIDEELDSKLKATAKAESMSVNQWIIKMLKKVTGLDKPHVHTKKYHDLDYLFGTWSEDDYKEFQETQKDFEKIDLELWQ